jgi:hypothetical protein
VNLDLLALTDVVIPGRSSSTLPQAYISGFKDMGSGVFEDHVVVATVGDPNCPPITINGPQGLTTLRLCVGFDLNGLSAAAADVYSYRAIGAGPFSYALTPISGSPPAGLTFGGDPPGISGKATSPGSYSFYIVVMDTKGCTDSALFTVTVVDCLSPPVKRRQ